LVGGLPYPSIPFSRFTEAGNFRHNLLILLGEFRLQDAGKQIEIPCFSSNQCVIAPTEKIQDRNWTLAFMDEVAPRAADPGSDAGYYSVLMRILTAVSQDHAQLRLLVYELARRKLRKSLASQFEDGNWSGIQEQMQALEAAIDQIESDCAHKSLTFVPEPPLTYLDAIDGPASSKPGQNISNRPAAVPAAAAPQSGFSVPIQMAPDDGASSGIARFGQGTPPWVLRWKFQLMLAVVLGVVLFSAIIGALALDGWRARHGSALAEAVTTKSTVPEMNAPSDENASAAKLRKSNIPSMRLPSDYGAFALSNGRLTELELLPMKIPDARVAISPIISAPSRTHLPIGKLEFVVFRRDLASAVPERVSLRIIARVVRALKFDSAGRPTTAAISDAWVIRSNSYPMRVAPIADNPEMILIRPEQPDLSLPAGRYALVLKGIAYDFSLDGPTTDTAHCLERTDTLGSPIYTECRTP
jgi:hypothetical protein